MDKLDKLFEDQKKLQKFFKQELDKMNYSKKKSYVYDNLLDSMEELKSIQKKISKNKFENLKNVSEQNVSDLLHFVLNLCIVLEIEPNELYDIYEKRNIHIYENKNKYKRKRR